MFGWLWSFFRDRFLFFKTCVDHSQRVLIFFGTDLFVVICVEGGGRPTPCGTWFDHNHRVLAPLVHRVLHRQKWKGESRWRYHKTEG